MLGISNSSFDELLKNRFDVLDTAELPNVFSSSFLIVSILISVSSVRYSNPLIRKIPIFKLYHTDLL